MPATYLRFMPLATALLLTACGGGGGGSDNTDITPSLGLIRNATVNFYRADDAACPAACPLLATGNSGSTGVITANITGYSGPMVIEIVGGGSAEYFDEESEQFEPFLAGDRLRALTPGSRGRFGVTILTELAYQRAVIEERFPLTSLAVTNINQSIGDALAPEISSGILTVPTLISDTTADGSLLNNTQSLYAIKLAALARLGSGGSPSPALAVLNALVEDIQDGSIDGLVDGNPLTPPAPYNAATLGADIKTAMDSFASVYGNASLISRVSSVTPVGNLDLFEPPDNGGGDNGGGDNGGGDNGGGDNGGGSDILGDANGITGLFNGERRTASINSYTGPPLSIGVGYATAGQVGDSFQVNLSGIVTQLDVDRACANSGIPGLTVTFNDVVYSGAPMDEGNCIVTTAELSSTLILVRFSGTLTRVGDNESAPATLAVTEGEFQFRVPLFDGSFPQPEVRASFEGLTLGQLWQQGNGTDDRGWEGSWGPSAMSVFNVSSNPLAVTPSGGSELSGGDRALRFPGVADSTFGSSEVRFFERRFNGDVYVSTLWRVDTATPGSNKARISFGNPAVFMGIDSGYDAAIDGTRINQFTVSLGDAENQRAYAGGAVQGNTTHHIVGRLYKAEGSATYNRFDLWVDPARNASGNPLATASTDAGTGSLSFIGAIGFAGQFIQNSTTVDRIRFSSSWDGVFEDVEPEVPEPTGTCGGTEEAPYVLSNVNAIGTCAGTYPIAFVHRDVSHSRGTVIIGEDNSIDFDTGIVLGSATATVTNRITSNNRIDVSYSNGDKITLYRTDKGVLRNVHYEPSGGTAVKVSMLPQLPEGNGTAAALTSTNLVASGTVNNVARIQQTVFGTSFPVSGNFGVFEVRGQGHMGTVPDTIWTLTDIPATVGTHYCEPYDFTTRITYLRVSDSGAAQSGGGPNSVGRCTVTVTSIQTNPMNPSQIFGAEGKFAVELLSTGPDGTGKLVDIVTDGYFRFFRDF